MRRALAWAGTLVLVLAMVPGMECPVFAGTTGKLAGKVVNEKREPLAGAHVRIERLRIGVMSDEGGNYFLIGVPAGRYTVHASHIGHAAFTAGNVEISPSLSP